MEINPVGGWSVVAQYLGLILFNNVTNCLKKGIVSQFAESTKLDRNVDSLEEKKAQQRDLVRLDQWVEANFMRSSKAKCWVLHLSESNNLPTAPGRGRVAGKLSWGKGSG